MKRLLSAILALILVPATALAQGMTSQILGGGANLTTGTGYLGPTSNGRGWIGTPGQATMVMPVAVTLSNFRIKLTAAPGDGEGRYFTVYKNGSSTALNVQMFNNETTKQDTTNSVSFAAGDTIAIEQIADIPATSFVYWSLKAVTTSTNEYPLLAGSASSTIQNGTTRYLQLQGDSAPSTTGAAATVVFPTAGVISNLYVALDSNSVTSTFTLTLYKNGSPTALTAAVVAGTATINNTSDTVSFAAGDTAYWEMVNAGSTSPRAKVGCKFAPTIDGEAIGLWAARNALNQNTSNNYLSLFSGGNTSQTTQAAMGVNAQASTLKKLFVYLSSNVGGSGQTFTATVNKATVATTLTCQIASGAATCSDIAHEEAIANDDVLNSVAVLSATTGSLSPAVGAVLYIEQATPTPTPTATPTATSTATATATATPTATPRGVKGGVSLLGCGK